MEKALSDAGGFLGRLVLVSICFFGTVKIFSGIHATLVSVSEGMIFSTFVIWLIEAYFFPIVFSILSLLAMSSFEFTQKS